MHVLHSNSRNSRENQRLIKNSNAVLLVAMWTILRRTVIACRTCKTLCKVVFASLFGCRTSFLACIFYAHDKSSNLSISRGWRLLIGAGGGIWMACRSVLLLCDCFLQFPPCANPLTILITINMMQFCRFCCNILINAN